MLELIINFTIGLTIIGIPSLAFYKIGVDAGIERGEKRQILKELLLSGVIERAEPEFKKPPVITRKLRSNADRMRRARSSAVPA